MPEPDTTPAADDLHVCKPGASVYYCPTAGETESDCHGGFDVCCDRPDLHQPLIPCAWDVCKQSHDGHSWEPQPGTPLVYCEGTTGRTETGATIANPQVQGGGAGDSGADNDGLRERYAAALRATVAIPGATPSPEEERVLADLTDAVLAVRDQEMQALRGRLRKAERAVDLLAGSHRRAEEAEAALAAGIPLVCSDERHEAKVAALQGAIARVQAELDRIAALPTVTVDDGHADRFSVGARWTLNLIRTALTPPAPGGHDGEGR